MTLGSLFDGIGGFPAVAAMCGIETRWASEVEPFPIAVTHSRFPCMVHLGDISTIDGALIESVDIVTFGSPCQDMSIAGKREGLKHSEQGDDETTRSGLFYEAARIIKEMRESTDGEYPRYAVWENVPGAFSSNKGRDFLAVLQTLASIAEPGVSIPEPAKDKRTGRLIWGKAGCIVGNGWSLAWRTLDAQYWGVPQRRRRIYLVADFAGERAGEILFERESVRGNTPPRGMPWQETARDAVGRADGSAGVECLGFDMYNQSSTGDKTRTLKTPAGGDDLPVIVLKERAGCDGGSKGALWSDSSPCADRGQNVVVQPCAAFMAGQGSKAGGIGYQEHVAPTLKGCPSGLNGDHNNRVTDYTAIAVDCRNRRIAGDISGTLQAKKTGGHSLNYVNPVIQPKPVTRQRSDEFAECEVASTQSARRHKDATDLVVQKLRKYIIRRLTPLECLRLQGYPDWWHDISYAVAHAEGDREFWESVRKTWAEINGKQYRPMKDVKKWVENLRKDSAEYKATGNSLALPCAYFVISRIKEMT